MKGWEDMNRFKLILEAPYSLDAIFELRKMPLLVTLLIGGILGTLMMSPFAISFLKTETYRFDESLWGLKDEHYELILDALPSCRINDEILECDEMMRLNVTDSFAMSINESIDDRTAGIMFFEDYFVFSDGTNEYELSYAEFGNLDFDSLRGGDELFDPIAASIKPLFVVPYVVSSYQTGFMIFYIYIVIVAAISMLRRFAHSSFLSFKEVFSLYVYSSIAPIFIATLIGLIIQTGFEMIIFQFGTPIIAYLTYKKKVVPFLQNMTS